MHVAPWLPSSCCPSAHTSPFALEFAVFLRHITLHAICKLFGQKANGAGPFVSQTVLLYHDMLPARHATTTSTTSISSSSSCSLSSLSSRRLSFHSCLLLCPRPSLFQSLYLYLCRLKLPLFYLASLSPLFGYYYFTLSSSKLHDIIVHASCIYMSVSFPIPSLLLPTLSLSLSLSFSVFVPSSTHSQWGSNTKDSHVLVTSMGFQLYFFPSLSRSLSHHTLSSSSALFPPTNCSI